MGPRWRLRWSGTVVVTPPAWPGFPPSRPEPGPWARPLSPHPFAQHEQRRVAGAGGGRVDAGAELRRLPVRAYGFGGAFHLAGEFVVGTAPLAQSPMTSPTSPITMYRAGKEQR
jgi:hypothetical protein